jgi:carboxyl-terminal processing protease
MRGGRIAGLGLLLAAGVVAAGPVSRPAPAVPREKAAALEAEARTFAHNLLTAAARLSHNYARPIDPADLVSAGLAGLYEAAHLSAPRGLAEAVHKAVAARSEGPPEPGPPSAAPNIDIAEPQEPAVAEFVRRAYVEAAAANGPQGRAALLAALRAMTATLDPYTTVIPAEEVERWGGLDEEYVGLGIETDEPAGDVVSVRGVQPGSPAQQAGVRPGDEITHLDGRPVAKVPDKELRARFQLAPANQATEVPAGTSVRLTLRRRGVPRQRTVELTVQRFRPETVLGVARHADNSWEYWLDRRRGIAQVRLGPLSLGTAHELGEVLARLRDGGLRGLALDLRWCPGGYVKEATGCAELFLGEKVIATTKERGQERVFRSTGEPKFQDLPVLVLTNAATSGGGELIAAALQDHGRARVAGQRSLGKGSIQTSVFLPEANVGLKVTSGTFLRPSGKGLHRFADSRPQDDWGVRPDAGLEFRTSAPLEKQLRQWWLLQTLRPGGAAELLPLDDPDADPQRQAAVEALVLQLTRK